MGVKFFHADIRTDGQAEGHDEANSRWRIKIELWTSWEVSKSVAECVILPCLWVIVSCICRHPVVTATTMVMLMKVSFIMVIWVTSPCIPVGWYRRFGASWCIRVQGTTVRLARYISPTCCYHLPGYTMSQPVDHKTYIRKFSNPVSEASRSTGSWVLTWVVFDLQKLYYSTCTSLWRSGCRTYL
jgi:hypothetical protein